MAVKKGGLGRGLDSLFADNSVEEINNAGAVKLRLMDLEPNRDQPRKVFDEAALAELADSIAQHGLLQPILVRPISGNTYQIVAGERRWRACRMAGLTEVPVVIREMTDEETAAVALIENLQREDLNPLEEAKGYQQLMEQYGLTQEEAAKRVGKSRPVVANALRLLKLPAAVLDMLENNLISAGHARALLAFEKEEELLAVAKLIVEKGLSVREVERLAKAAAKGEKPKPQKVKRSSYYDEVALSLTDALGRKVKVTTNPKGEGGTLVLDFFSKDDLKALANTLNALEN